MVDRSGSQRFIDPPVSGLLAAIDALRVHPQQRLPVVLATGDDRAEDRREHVTRDTQSVSPRPVLPRLIHQALAHVEDHSTDHAATLWHHRRPSRRHNHRHAEISTDLNRAGRRNGSRNWIHRKITEGLG